MLVSVRYTSQMCWSWKTSKWSCGQLVTDARVCSCRCVGVSEGGCDLTVDSQLAVASDGEGRLAWLVAVKMTKDPNLYRRVTSEARSDYGPGRTRSKTVDRFCGRDIAQAFERFTIRSARSFLTRVFSLMDDPSATIVASSVVWKHLALSRPNLGQLNQYTMNALHPASYNAPATICDICHERKVEIVPHAKPRTASTLHQITRAIRLFLISL